ncbi:hypothetical protein GW17_00032513 [Ensete ventricosum]|nr:hypothetical protein GW17_00032513 [Ensete ventricosum]
MPLHVPPDLRCQGPSLAVGLKEWVRKTRRRLGFQLENKVPPHHSVRRRGVASPSSRRMRQRMRKRLIPMKEDEVTPCLLARERGVASSQRRKMRHHLVPAHLPAEERGSASSQRRKNEASPRHWKMRHCLIPRIFF